MPTASRWRPRLQMAWSRSALPSPSASYLRVEQIIAAALVAGCDAVHPGYGFLAERPALAEACVDHELVFVGPPPDVIRRGGDKVQARAAANAAGVPIGAGSGAVRTLDAAAKAVDTIGYPVLLKAAAGGGGRGMVLVGDERQLKERFDAASAEAEAAFGDGRLVRRTVRGAGAARRGPTARR